MAARNQTLRCARGVVAIVACGSALAMPDCGFGAEIHASQPILGRSAAGRTTVIDEPRLVQSNYQRPTLRRSRIVAAPAHSRNDAPGIAHVDGIQPQEQPRGGLLGMFGRNQPAEDEMVDPFLAAEAGRARVAAPVPQRAAEGDGRFAAEPDSQLSRLRRYLIDGDAEPAGQAAADRAAAGAVPGAPRVELGEAAPISPGLLDGGRSAMPRQRTSPRPPADPRLAELERIIVRTPVARANRGAMVPVEFTETAFASDVTTGWKPVVDLPPEISDGTLRMAANSIRPIMVVSDQAEPVATRSAAQILSDAGMDDGPLRTDLAGRPGELAADDADGPFGSALAKTAPPPPATRLADLDVDEAALLDDSAAGAALSLPAQIGIAFGLLALLGLLLRKRRVRGRHRLAVHVPAPDRAPRTAANAPRDSERAAA
ncbi:MAG: hypothetical protein WD069_22720 [Planctomycetales bacterium]